MRGRTIDQLRALIMAGAGLDMSTRGYLAEDLRMLALLAAGREKPPVLVFREASWMTDDQLRFIALAGKGCVTFAD
jgi:hypothetical protein